VVLRPGKHCTEDELCAFVAEKLPDYKHLHGGVQFIEKLPMNRGGKLDRGQLKAMATKEELLKKTLII
jgi:acyl-coenzyme A synthetase/AMP-(fatty) acid ligase